MATSLTYNKVLTCYTWIGDIDKMHNYAVELGYPFFLWNGRVYSVDFCTGERVDTGKTIDDIR